MFTEIIPQIKKSIFALLFYTYDGTTLNICGVATGFMYSPKFIVTAGHSFESLPKDVSVNAIDADNFESQSRGFLVKVDPELDLAIIRVHRSLASSCVKLSNNKIPVGAKCGTLGFANSLWDESNFHLSLKFQAGYVAYSQDSPSEGDHYPYEIDSTTYPGSSGAPVFTEDGEVFGMVGDSLVNRIEGLPDERMIYTRCVSSLDILEFCKDFRLKKSNIL